MSWRGDGARQVSNKGQAGRILRALGSRRSFWSRGSRGMLEHLKDFFGHPVDKGNLEEENGPTCFRKVLKGGRGVKEDIPETVMIIHSRSV